MKTSLRKEATFSRLSGNRSDSSAIKSKRILFIGGNFYPEPTGIGKYNGEMIDQLAGYGYHCTVITSYPYYPYWKVQVPYSGRAYWYKKEVRENVGTCSGKVEIFRCPQYVPSRPNGFGRMLLDLTFFLSSFLKVLQLLFQKRYDYVISVVPCFPIGLHGILYKKIKKARFIYHIQDLQIDAAKELRLIRSEIIINFLLRVERYILKSADVVSSISIGMINKLKAKCNRDIVLFPNWVDTDAFYPIQGKEDLKKEFGFSYSDRIVLYSGAIGEKQGLEIIIKAANTLRHVQKLKFVICGSGPYKDKLVVLVNELNLDNVIFLPLQPSERFNCFLNMADVHLVLQKANATDLVMPSKLAAILSVSGLVVVAASVHSNLYQLVLKNEMGITIAPECQDSLVVAIQCTLNKNYESFKRNARNYAERFLTKERVIFGYMQYIAS